ncbi:MAG: LytR C-terminal domain-containing protein [Nocardioidaceae bacterium]
MKWRTPITLVILLGILVGAAIYGWKTVISPVTNSNSTAPTASGPTCTKKVLFKKGSSFRAKDILVNVYNAGSQAGLAANTLDVLHSKGFRAGVALNAPAKITTRNVTVLTTSKTSPQTELVAHQFAGKVKVRIGPALAPGVDVVIGNYFKGVKAHTHTVLTLAKEIDACVRSAG